MFYVLLIFTLDLGLNIPGESAITQTLHTCMRILDQSHIVDLVIEEPTLPFDVGGV